MSKCANPDWLLNAEWGVGRDPHNWILYQRSGKRWRQKGYYPNPAQLLQSLHRKILRTELPHSDLTQHLEACLNVVQACTERFAEQLYTYMGPASKMTPHIAAASLDRQYG